MGRTTIPSRTPQGPFTAKVASGYNRRIASTSPGSFEFVSQAQEWCHQERARLLITHPRRHFIGSVLNKDGALHIFAFA